MLFQVDAREPIKLTGEKLVRSFLHYDAPLMVTQNVFVLQINIIKVTNTVGHSFWKIYDFLWSTDDP